MNFPTFCLPIAAPHGFKPRHADPESEKDPVFREHTSRSIITLTPCGLCISVLLSTFQKLKGGSRVHKNSDALRQPCYQNLI